MSTFLQGHQKLTAIGTICLLGTINILGTRWGNRVQNVATIIKAGFVAFLAVLPFMAIRSEPFRARHALSAPADSATVVGIGAAVAAIMWAYDGWGNVTVVAEEVHNAASQRAAGADRRRRDSDRALYRREPGLSPDAVVGRDLHLQS